MQRRGDAGGCILEESTALFRNDVHCVQQTLRATMDGLLTGEEARRRSLLIDLLLIACVGIEKKTVSQLPRLGKSRVYNPARRFF